MSMKFHERNEIKHDTSRYVFDDIVDIQLQVNDIENRYDVIIHMLNELKTEHKNDHDELSRLLVTRDFFWRIIIKTIIPLMFVIFGIGWMTGKYAQHIASALGW